MASTTLDYGRPDPRRPRWRRRWRGWYGYALAATALLLVSLVLPGKAVQTRIDAVTGTTSRVTRWPLGVTTGPRVRTTALEQRLRSAGIAWTPAWQFFGESGQTLFGGRTYVACSLAPPVYTLVGFRRQEYWAAVTDDELRDLVFVLQLGTEDEQTAAVAAMEEKIVAALDASPAGCGDRD